MTRNEAAERLRESMRQKGFYYVDLLQEALAEERSRVDLPRTDREDEVFAAGYKEGFEAASQPPAASDWTRPLAEGHPTCPFCYERGRKGAAVTEGLDVERLRLLWEAAEDANDWPDFLRRLAPYGLSAEQPDIEAQK